MDKNKEIRALSEDEVEKISGGRLSDEELKEFFPGTEYPEAYKNSYAVEVCKKCGKRFARNVHVFYEASERGWESYRLKQEYCEECANEILNEKFPL